jgi:hypothetical protein
MNAQFGSKYYEDPSIASCCAVQYDRLWQRIAEKVAEGMWFYRAREIVLAEEVPDMSKAFGRVVAQRVSKAIQHTDPEMMPDWVKKAVKARNIAEFETFLTEKRGGVSWANRLSLKLTGYPLYC